MKAPEKIWINPTLDLPKLNGVLDKDSVEYIRKDSLVKYLSEEKGYPITLNGELLHWDELNKHLAEYNKWKKDAFIKKACEFIASNMKCDGYTLQIKAKFINEFKNYMKGE